MGELNRKPSPSVFKAKQKEDFPDNISDITNRQANKIKKLYCGEANNVQNRALASDNDSFKILEREKNNDEKDVCGNIVYLSNCEPSDTRPEKNETEETESNFENPYQYPFPARSNVNLQKSNECEGKGYNTTDEILSHYSSVHESGTNINNEKMDLEKKSHRDSRLKSKTKYGCEYHDQELDLDEGELPSLELTVRTEPRVLNPSRVDSVRLLNGNGKYENLTTSCSNSPTKKELSSRSKLRHRSFWIQLNTVGVEEVDEEYANEVIGVNGKVRNDFAIEDRPDDEMAIDRSNSKFSSSYSPRHGLNNRKNVAYPIEVIENEKEEDMKGIVSMVMDMCSDCAWSMEKEKRQPTRNSRENRRVTTLDDPRNRIYIKDSVSYESDYEEEESRNEKTEYSYETCAGERGTIGRNMSKSFLQDVDEPTAIEVEYIAPSSNNLNQNDPNHDFLQSETKMENEAGDLSTIAEGVEDDLSKSFFLQQESKISDSKSTLMMRSGLSSVNSKRWSAPEKNAYLRALAKKAKEHFLKEKVVKEEQTLSDCADSTKNPYQLGNIDEITTDSRIGKRNGPHDDMSMDSVDKILGKSPLVKGRDYVELQRAISSNSTNVSIPTSIDWSQPELEKFNSNDRKILTGLLCNGRNTLRNAIVMLENSQRKLASENYNTTVEPSKFTFCKASNTSQTTKVHSFLSDRRGAVNDPGDILSTSIMDLPELTVDNVSLLSAENETKRVFYPRLFQSEAKSSIDSTTSVRSKVLSPTFSLPSITMTPSSSSDKFKHLAYYTVNEAETETAGLMVSGLGETNDRDADEPVLCKAKSDLPTSSGRDIHSSHMTSAKIASSILGNLRKKHGFDNTLKSDSLEEEKQSQLQSLVKSRSVDGIQEFWKNGDKKKRDIETNLYRKNSSTLASVKKKTLVDRKSKKEYGKFREDDESNITLVMNDDIKNYNNDKITFHQEQNNLDSHKILKPNQNLETENKCLSHDPPTLLTSKSFSALNDVSPHSKTIPLVIVDPFLDSSDVSITKGQNAEALSTSSSVFTVSTNASSWSTSTRKRHRGAARKRILEAFKDKNNMERTSSTAGWLESIRKAAIEYHREWDPKVGWVGYVEPEKLSSSTETEFDRIGTIKSLNSSSEMMDKTARNEHKINNTSFDMNSMTKNKQSFINRDKKMNNCDRLTPSISDNSWKQRKEQLGMRKLIANKVASTNGKNHDATASDVTEVHQNLRKVLYHEFNQINFPVESEPVTSVCHDLRGDRNFFSFDNMERMNPPHDVIEEIPEKDLEVNSDSDEIGSVCGASNNAIIPGGNIQLKERTSPEHKKQNNEINISVYDEVSPHGLNTLPFKSPGLPTIVVNEMEPTRKSGYSWVNDANIDIENTTNALGDDLSSVNEESTRGSFTHVRPSQLDFASVDGKTLTVSSPELRVVEHDVDICSKFNSFNSDSDGVKTVVTNQFIHKNSLFLSLPRRKNDLVTQNNEKETSKHIQEEDQKHEGRNFRKGVSGSPFKLTKDPKNLSQHRKGFISGQFICSSSDEDGSKIFTKKSATATNVINYDKTFISDSERNNFYCTLEDSSVTNHISEKDGEIYSLSLEETNHSSLPTPQNTSKINNADDTSIKSLSSKAKLWIDHIETNEKSHSISEKRPDQQNDLLEKVREEDSRLIISSKSPIKETLYTPIFVSSTENGSSFQKEDPRVSENDEDTLFEFIDINSEKNIQNQSLRSFSKKLDKTHTGALSLEKNINTLTSRNSSYHLEGLRSVNKLTKNIANSDPSFCEQQNNSFFRRLQSCAVPVIDRVNEGCNINAKEPEKSGDGVGGVPLAHLAFLRKGQSSSYTGKSSLKEKNIPAKNIIFKTMPSNVCGGSIANFDIDADKYRIKHNHFDEDVKDSKNVSMKCQFPRERSLEDVAVKPSKIPGPNVARFGSNNSKHLESWQRFLQKRSSSGTTLSQKSNTSSSVTKAAETYAVKKVNEIMRELSHKLDKENSKNSICDETKLRHGKSNRLIDNISDKASYSNSNDFPQYPKKSLALRAAEDLAAARIDAMMNAMSSGNCNEG